MFTSSFVLYSYVLQMFVIALCANMLPITVLILLSMPVLPLSTVLYLGLLTFLSLICGILSIHCILSGKIKIKIV